jgi:two-component system, sensor histidine kinase
MQAPDTTFAISPERLARIRADQTQALFDTATFGLVVSLVAAIALYVFLLRDDEVSIPAITAWIIVMVLQTAVRLGLLYAYHRIKPQAELRKSWLTTVTVGALVGGLCWGIGSLLIAMQCTFDIQLLVIICISAVVYASLSGLGSYMPFYALLFPALTPLTIWSAFQPDAKHIAYAVLTGIWIPAVAWLGYRHESDVVGIHNLRHENLDLLKDLHVQKDLAEQANVAKSRFLASASHDLRQPVHALSMFIGALKEYAFNEPARRLLGHIESSIAALDELFTSLLDISRLDAGVISVNPISFPIQPMLERVCRDLALEAKAKGLTLKVVASSAWVESDPVLLERILRNLVSNGIRYTEKGRVLVGCRRGARIRVQVWDTGPGIAPTLREKVFEEFFQIGNLGRDRSQGLGLGLAIVRRLTQLLDHPLRLETAEGRGTMFEVQLLPSVPTQITLPIAVPVPSPPQGTVLVIDDESAICEAMRSLLESWGYGVITAGSGSEILQRIATVTSAPGLIVSDYRLQNGEDGISLIRRLQSEFNEEIPALLITGDTAPDRLAEARASGLLLLHKPVTADRLKQVIQSLT